MRTDRMSTNFSYFLAVLFSSCLAALPMSHSLPPSDPTAPSATNADAEPRLSSSKDITPRLSQIKFSRLVEQNDSLSTPSSVSALEAPLLSCQPFERLAVLRILDANLDRAREGIRTIEEWCRFGLNDEASTAQLKHLRQVLASWHSSQIRASRDTPGDLGTGLTHAKEAVRTSLLALLQANFARVQEALRVLEEYGKLYNLEMSAACKQMRYQLYTIDSQVLDAQVLDAQMSDAQILDPMVNSEFTPAHLDESSAQRWQQLARAHTYLVTLPVPNFLEVIESALKGGVAIVQYREKTAADDERLAMAKQMRSLCHRYGALFIVNDRIDIAAASDADGVHLGQHDLPMEVARRILGPDKIVGRSTTNPQELQRALAEKADYIGVGPVHETPTKPGKAASGNDYVRYAAEHATMPWFTIGGLNADNLEPTLAAGATRVAVVRALMEADDPAEVARSLVRQTQQHASSR